MPTVHTLLLQHASANQAHYLYLAMLVIFHSYRQKAHFLGRVAALADILICKNNCWTTLLICDALSFSARNNCLILDDAHRDYDCCSAYHSTSVQLFSLQSLCVQISRLAETMDELSAFIYVQPASLWPFYHQGLFVLLGLIIARALAQACKIKDDIHFE